jgi:hypothetical protein
MPQSRVGRVSPPNDNYTAILAVAVGVMLATIAYVAYACQTCYGTIYKMP